MGPQILSRPINNLQLTKYYLEFGSAILDICRLIFKHYLKIEQSKNRKYNFRPWRSDN